MEVHAQAQGQTILDRARKMVEIGRLEREKQEKARRKTRGGSVPPSPINTKPAGPGMKLVEVPEDVMLQLMWEKACAPRHSYSSSAAWKPRPNDPGDELVSQANQKARAIIRSCHLHVDGLILQYVNNGRAYEEVQIGDDDTAVAFLKATSHTMMAETGTGTTSGNQTAAAADVPTIYTKPAGPKKKTTKIQVFEAYILSLMWYKACRPRGDFPSWLWKPPSHYDSTKVKVIQKACAAMYNNHQREDDLISQYINNGCAYEEVEIGDDE